MNTEQSPERQSFDEQRAEKWEKGRIEYGGNEWVGQPPLLEFVEEMLDAANYLDEAVKRGDLMDGIRVMWIEQLKTMADCASFVEDLRQRQGGSTQGTPSST